MEFEIKRPKKWNDQQFAVPPTSLPIKPQTSVPYYSTANKTPEQAALPAQISPAEKPRPSTKLIIINEQKHRNVFQFSTFNHIHL